MRILLYFLAHFMIPIIVNASWLCPDKGLYLKTDDNTCASYYKCALKGSEGVPKSCCSGVFSEEYQSCSVTNKCKLVEAPSGFTCPRSGKFLNSDDKTCTTYFSCVIAGQTGIKTNCCGGVFSQGTETCDVNNKCVLPEQSEYNCTKYGMFLNANDSSCKSFYKCPRGEVFGEKHSCAEGIFSETNKTCSKSNRCSLTDKPGQFSCSKTGLFLNEEDHSCTTFFQCLEVGGEPFKFSCAVGVFSNANQTCSTSNKCQLTQEPNSFNCTKLGLFLNNNDFTCKTFYQCTAVGVNGTMFDCAVGVFSELNGTCATTNQCINTGLKYIDTSDKFTCAEKGKFPVNCTAYYNCKLQGNAILNTIEICPKNYNFNPSMQTCQIKSRYPCN